MGMCSALLHLAVLIFMEDLAFPKQKWRRSGLRGGNKGEVGEGLGGENGGETVDR